MCTNVFRLESFVETWKVFENPHQNPTNQLLSRLCSCFGNLPPRISFSRKNLKTVEFVKLNWKRPPNSPYFPNKKDLVQLAAEKSENCRICLDTLETTPKLTIFPKEEGSLSASSRNNLKTGNCGIRLVTLETTPKPTIFSQRRR